MKFLLDENLPKRLKKDFPEHEIYTVNEKKWQGKKNGELIGLMIRENFDALFTFDKNLEYQQNFSKYKICSFYFACTGQYISFNAEFGSIN